MKRFGTSKVLKDLPAELAVGQTLLIQFPRGRTLANRLWRKYGPGTCSVKKVSEGLWSVSRLSATCNPDNLVR